MRTLKTPLTGLAAAALAATAAMADGHATTTLRVQSLFPQESPSGQLAQQFVDNVERMSGGEIDIEIFYSSAVVKSVETFDAAVSGILDCDMTGASYQTSKNPAFQFIGDIMGGYDTPYQQLSWLYYGGGMDAAQELFHAYDMHLVGWWVPGQESLSSSRPLRNVEDFKNWKFRSPPGMETKIFEKLGASPIVMDFTEVFTALETGIIDGADAAGIATNVSLGLFDIVEHATFPGFHSMPSDHLACNKAVWDGLPDDHRAIIEIAMESLALRTALTFEKVNAEAAAELAAKGISIYNWTAEDRAEFRAVAQETWHEFATTPEAKALVESHLGYLRQLGLTSE
ncbi:TRAP transporter substrate-binding protein [Jannaschia sp. M317]|uniref:TRAP transporter substrate-binding protein n=1 Tax=Jannaschia sp. M317 TaxID=2867011 RepID=UPI0021A65FED|nr:TRAP transporter substrate-binding protein [Jannaschia sp. M317]UWQ19953.1 TRAP transporter substrate-binding protein [Jannaschia sp. M317]